MDFFRLSRGSEIISLVISMIGAVVRVKEVKDRSQISSHVRGKKVSHRPSLVFGPCQSVFRTTCVVFGASGTTQKQTPYRSAEVTYFRIAIGNRTDHEVWGRVTIIIHAEGVLIVTPGNHADIDHGQHSLPHLSNLG